MGLGGLSAALREDGEYMYEIVLRLWRKRERGLYIYYS